MDILTPVVLIQGAFKNSTSYGRVASMYCFSGSTRLNPGLNKNHMCCLYFILYPCDRKRVPVVQKQWGVCNFATALRVVPPRVVFSIFHYGASTDADAVDTPMLLNMFFRC